MNFLSILNSFEDKQIKMLKEDFEKEFTDMIQEEKKYCAEKGVVPQMNSDKIREIKKMLRKCWTAYHVEALKRLVLQEMLVPTMQDVDAKANDLMTKALHV